MFFSDFERRREALQQAIRARLDHGGVGADVILRDARAFRDFLADEEMVVPLSSGVADEDEATIVVKVDVIVDGEALGDVNG